MIHIMSHFYSGVFFYSDAFYLLYSLKRKIFFFSFSSFFTSKVKIYLTHTHFFNYLFIFETLPLFLYCLLLCTF
ncbi:hypothetical protein EDC96DRAFT_93590 [Choanephora cucurbitarum]|nr:hypothetical protein EDC96DRAFT_93590 [Choanephora cucurbitarum]